MAGFGFDAGAFSTNKFGTDSCCQKHGTSYMVLF